MTPYKKKININIILLCGIFLLIVIIINLKYNNTHRYESFTSENKKNIFIVTSISGKNYAKRVKEEMDLLNRNLNIKIMNVQELVLWSENKTINPDLVIVRSATPTDSKWISCLKKLENENVKVINPTKVLQLTSNKLTSSLHLVKQGIPHPFSKGGIHNDEKTLNTITEMFKTYDKLIIKPFTSRDQGEYVQKINKEMTQNEIIEKINKIPAKYFVIQEFIPYEAIYRVIVINNKALPISYKDVPTQNKWKVSVCLNPSMTVVPNPPKKLLETAKMAQRAIYDGGVHFIDLFKVNDEYIISEINTSCSLLLHEKKAKEINHKYSNIAHYLAKYYLSLL